MVNTSRKGSAKERLCRQRISEMGYEILFKSQRVPFGKIDFGPFDVVAVKTFLDRGSGIGWVNKPMWLFISVTHEGAKSISGEIELIRKFMRSYFFSDAESGSMRAQLWVWLPGKTIGRGWKKHFRKADFSIHEVEIIR